MVIVIYGFTFDAHIEPLPEDLRIADNSMLELQGQLTYYYKSYLVLLKT